MAFQVGQQVRLRGTFYNLNGAKEDPATVTLKVRNAANETTTYTYAAAEITRDGVGEYHKDVTITKPASGNGGNWYYRYESTGLIAANETSFPVEQTVF